MSIFPRQQCAESQLARRLHSLYHLAAWAKFSPTSRMRSRRSLLPPPVQGKLDRRRHLVRRAPRPGADRGRRGHSRQAIRCPGPLPRADAGVYVRVSAVLGHCARFVRDGTQGDGERVQRTLSRTWTPRSRAPSPPRSPATRAAASGRLRLKGPGPRFHVDPPLEFAAYGIKMILVSDLTGDGAPRHLQRLAHFRRAPVCHSAPV